MQSSGFLDLKSLSALSQTCKANAFDELSLIQLIEHEITRHHGVKTVGDAIHFWRRVYRFDPLLKQWRERAEPSAAAIVTRQMLADAVPYEVMLAKMLRTVPTQSERFQLVKGQYDTTGRLVRSSLHDAAKSGNHESLKIILSLYPNESKRLLAVRKKDRRGNTVLHYAATSKEIDCFKTILFLYPESERLHAVNIKDSYETTVYCAARSGNSESIKLILSLYPETENLRVAKENSYFGTALHYAALSGNFESIEAILALYPESERLQALSATVRLGETVLDRVAASNDIECIKAVLSLYPESQRLWIMNEPNRKRRTMLSYMNEETRNSVMRWVSE